MDLDKSAVCKLQSYPVKTAPFLLNYLENTKEVMACNNFYNFTYTYLFGSSPINCYKLNSSDSSNWTYSPPMVTDHHDYTYFTKSFYLNNGDLFVIGSNDSTTRFISTALWSSDGNSLSATPTGGLPNMTTTYQNYPSGGCAAKLNDTHIMVVGGLEGEHSFRKYLSSAWILNLADYTWQLVEPMNQERYGHACILTAEGEVLVAGGVTDNGKSYNAEIYNPITNSWRNDSFDLPAKSTVFADTLLYEKKVIMLPQGTTNPWIRTESGWKNSNVSLGGTFDGNWGSKAVMVPKDAFNCFN